MKCKRCEKFVLFRTESGYCKQCNAILNTMTMMIHRVEYLMVAVAIIPIQNPGMRIIRTRRVL